MNTQPMKPGYLVMGIVFVSAALLWALDASDVLGFTDADEFGPIALIVLGILGVAASVRSIATREPADEAGS